MLRDQVRELFDGVLNAHRIDVYVRIIDLLESRGVTTFYYYILELIATREKYDNQDLVIRFDDIIIEQLNEVFEQLGITVADDAAIEDLVYVLEGMLGIETHDDPDYLASIIEAEDDEQMAICQILEYITGVPKETLSLWVLSVTHETLVNIEALSLGNDVDEDSISLPEDPVAYEKTKERIKKYLMQHEGPSIINIFIDNDVRIGTAFETLLEFAVKRGLFDFESVAKQSPLAREASPEQKVIGHNLIACSLFAGQDYNTAVNSITQTLTQAALSPSSAANIMAFVKDTATRVLTNG